MNRTRLVLAVLVVLLGGVFWVLVRHDPAVAQTWTLGYIALLATVAVVSHKWS